MLTLHRLIYLLLENMYLHIKYGHTICMYAYSKMIRLSMGQTTTKRTQNLGLPRLSQMNCEKKAEEKLNKLGFETYLPIQKEERQWSDRRKFIERILVRADKGNAQSIRNLSFVHKLITYPGSKEIATPIPDEQINQLKFLLSNAESEVSIISDIKVGDEVQIIREKLKGLKGMLCMINTKSRY